MILNGASSTGKTTLAQAFQERRAAVGDCWLRIALDDFNVLLPHPWFAAGDHEGPFAEDGIRFVETDDGRHIRTGALGSRLLATYRRTAALWARQGFNVLVDEVCLDEDAALDWDEALAGLPATWVAVRCDPPVAEARERARGDRLPGLARGMRHAVDHRHHDLELDTSADDPTTLAARLEQLLARA